MKEFETIDLKLLMQVYHGKKKDSIASTCAFLAKLTNLPEERNCNPAYVLQHFGLWDNSDMGLTTTIPSELLDRSISRSSPEEEMDFKTGVRSRRGDIWPAKARYVKLRISLTKEEIIISE